MEFSMEFRTLHTGKKMQPNPEFIPKIRSMVAKHRSVRKCRRPPVTRLRHPGWRQMMMPPRWAALVGLVVDVGPYYMPSITLIVRVLAFPYLYSCESSEIGSCIRILLL